MKIIIMATMLSLAATQAMAVLTLPISEGATANTGEMSIQGGITMGEIDDMDLNMYGGRINYGLMDGVSVFAGGGLIDPDHFDTEIYLQAGGKYQLPLDLPVDLAVRAAAGFTSIEEKSAGVKATADILMLNGGLLASMSLDYGLTVYGFGGLSFQKMDTEVSYTDWRGARVKDSDDDTETELAIAGGAIFNLNNAISFYAEVAHIDDLYLSAGAKIAFGGF